MTNHLSKAPDLKALRRLYQSDGAAHAFFDYLAFRKNNSRESTVDRLVQALPQHGLQISRRELIALLQSLVPLGVGDFVVGRRGQPSRFCWSVGMIGLARVVRGDSDAVIEPIDATEITAETDEEQLVASIPQAGFISHVYQLRPETRVTVSLPANLTAREAARFAEFIKTLPFEEGREVQVTAH